MVSRTIYQALCCVEFLTSSCTCFHGFYPAPFNHQHHQKAVIVFFPSSSRIQTKHPWSLQTLLPRWWLMRATPTWAHCQTPSISWPFFPLQVAPRPTHNSLDVVPTGRRTMRLVSFRAGQCTRMDLARDPTECGASQAAMSGSVTVSSVTYFSVCSNFFKSPPPSVLIQSMYSNTPC